MSCVDDVLAVVGDETLAASICEAAGGDCPDIQACIISYLSSEADAAAGASDAASGVGQSLDIFYLLFSAYLVFSMQAGFAMLCAGSIRSKNCMNILLKNVLDTCIGGLAYYIVGYGFAFGVNDNNGTNGFIGAWNFALSRTTQGSYNAGPDLAVYGWHQYLFQWSFAAAATTIVSGAVAERCTFHAYLMYATFISAFVYPVITHWMWSTEGWLSSFRAEGPLINGVGAIDFAGSGVVHMTGGVAALFGAAIIGPRIGRFNANGKPNPMPGHSATLIVLGTFILWFGWYGFNPGSMLFISNPVLAEGVGRAAVCTTLSAAAGGTSMLFLVYALTKVWNPVYVCMGVLSGLVAITAGCSVLEPWAAVVCGLTAAPIMYGAEKLLLKLKIDDPVSAFPVHGAAGAWGVIFVGLLAAPNYVDQVYGAYYGAGTVMLDKKYGAFYGGSGKLLLNQVIEVGVIWGWVGLLMGSFFLVMRITKQLRVPVEEELAGLDVSKHGGHNYGDEEIPADTLKMIP